jgi:hypothetical protein
MLPLLVFFATLRFVPVLLILVARVFVARVGIYPSFSFRCAWEVEAFHLRTLLQHFQCGSLVRATARNLQPSYEILSASAPVGACLAQTPWRKNAFLKPQPQGFGDPQ